MALEKRMPFTNPVSGTSNENIDQMLMERHRNKKARRSSHKNHMKRIRKRTEEDDVRFAQSGKTHTDGKIKRRCSEWDYLKKRQL